MFNKYILLNFILFKNISYYEALKNKRQIELNYLKKRQSELIDFMRTTTDKTAQISILQELNNLTKLIAGKNKDGE